jgi:hypothetical protein
MKKHLLVMTGALLLAGCARQLPSGNTEAPGFLLGVLHGLLALPSLIGSFIWDNPRLCIPKRWPLV